jgi:hypothetical protein
MMLSMLAAMAALSAVSVAGASAKRPEFELKEEKSFPIKFSDTNHGATTLETSAKEVISCKEESVEGEITGTTTVAKVIETLNGCQGKLIGVGACANTGTETIKTAPLKGVLGFVSESSKQVGLELEGEKAGPKEPLWAEFTCATAIGALPVVVEGHVFSAIEAEHKKLNEHVTLTYGQTKGIQSVTHFEGGSEQQLQATSALGTHKLGVAAESALGMLPTKETIAIRENSLEFEPAGGTGKFPVKFSDTSQGAPIITASGKGFEPSCGKETIVGQVANATTINKVVITLTECQLRGVACGNVGTSTIETVPLKGMLGYLNRTTEEVGLKLQPESGTLWAEFICHTVGGEKVEIEGSLIGYLNPHFNEKRSSLQPYYGASVGKQEIVGFEGGATGQQLHVNWPYGYETLGFEKEDSLQFAAGEQVTIL